MTRGREIGSEPRRALVVGASDGIGRATVARLLADAWEVTGLSRSASSVADARYEHVVTDVASPSFRTTLASLAERRGPFDVCVYCAGIGDRVDLANLAADARTFEVNLMGAVIAAEVVVGGMIARGRGHFVVLSSLADELVSRESPAYNASKAALSSYFEGLALAVRDRHPAVAITNVRFGFVDTKMAKSPSKPFMISADAAATVVVHALHTRRIRVTHPWPMAFLVRVLRWLVAWKIRRG